MQMRQLHGTIRDAEGHPIPDATINVVDKGSLGIAYAQQFQTDAQGRFSANLRDGDYVVFFTAPNMNEHAISFTISGAAADRDLQIVLSRNFISTD